MEVEQSIKPDSQTSLIALYTSLSSPQYQQREFFLEKKKHHFHSNLFIKKVGGIFLTHEASLDKSIIILSLSSFTIAFHVPFYIY